jgi:integrase
MEFQDYLKAKRPNLSPSSIYSYCSTLRALHKRLFGDTIIDINNFHNTELILTHLKNKEPATRKTSLAILYSLTDEEIYRTEMLNDIEKINAIIETQEMNEKQKEAHRSQQEIKALFDTCEEEANALYKKDTLTNNDKQIIQKYIILALTSGLFIPPRRSLDWCEFKINNITPDSNYLEGDNLVFNRYKGSATKGQQVVPCPAQLKNLLYRWIAVNDNDYLLFDKNGNKLSSVKMNQRLNQIFDGKTGINAIRHSYLSSKFQNLIEEDEKLVATMKSMGSSIAQKKVYINKL